MNAIIEKLPHGDGHLAYVAGFIVTANGDGSVPLNSKILAQKETETGAQQLIESWNALVEACEAILPYVADEASSEMSGPWWKERHDQLCAALALAKGEK